MEVHEFDDKLDDFEADIDELGAATAAKPS